MTVPKNGRVTRGGHLFNVLIVAEEGESRTELHSGLVRGGFACSIAFGGEEAVKQVARQAPDLLLVELDGQSTGSVISALSGEMKLARPLPIIALVQREMLDSLDTHLGGVDDFVIKPCDVGELVLRAKRLLNKSTKTDTGEIIRCGDLVIDLVRCEVSVDGRLVVLTFKEYELLRFLASNRGRVFTRNVLLDRVWGHDYFGGDRTVDVHIRRLRSKIEDSSHTFIETVRNIGYRFGKNMK